MPARVADSAPLPSPAGRAAILTAYRRLVRGGLPLLCPVIGRRGPAAEEALLQKLARQGYSDGRPCPALTALGLEYARSLHRASVGLPPTPPD